MRRSLRLALAATLLATSCQGGGSGPSGACAPVERLLEPSAIHLLPGANATFKYSPPTSGPHRFPAPVPGVSTNPIDEAAQVAALEAGAVLLQYDPDTDDAAIAALEELAGTGDVIVAPGARAFDDSALIAFTAWGHRQLCSDVDVSAARSFIEDRADASGVDHNG